MILLLTIPHEQESRFDTDRPYKERNEVNMIHLGDITKIHGNEIEPVDCITFGSPCQDLSIAGRRAGLAGERSGLFMEAVRIIKEMRSSTNGLHPTFAIWENVPGAFSSNNGEDFRAVLEELARIGQADAVVPGPPRGGQMEQSRSNRRKRMVFGVATAGQSIFRSGPAQKAYRSYPRPWRSTRRRNII